MKFSLSWLKDHLETTATLDELSDALTMSARRRFPPTLARQMIKWGGHMVRKMLNYFQLLDRVFETSVYTLIQDWMRVPEREISCLKATLPCTPRTTYLQRLSSHSCSRLCFTSLGGTL